MKRPNACNFIDSRNPLIMLTIRCRSVLFAVLFSIYLPTGTGLAQGGLRFLAWDDEVADRELGLVMRSGLRQIEGLHPLQRSQPLPFRSDQTQIQVAIFDRADDEGEPLKLNVRLPVNAKNPLVVLLPDENAPTGLRGHSFDEPVEAFPWGAFRIINLTGRDLVLASPGRAVELPAGWSPVEFVLSGGASQPVSFALAEEPDTPVYSSIWRREEDMRRLVILLPGHDIRLGALALKVVPEFRSQFMAESAADED